MRVLRLSDDFVDLSHLESGCCASKQRPAACAVCSKTVVDQATTAAQSKGVNLSLTTADADPEAAIDVEKLERAITHLVSTRCAIRATEDASISD